jgi:hypothetical protein
MATRAALVLLLAGCNAPVGLPSLAEQTLVFGGRRSGERVSGELFFGSEDGYRGYVGGVACFSLDPSVVVTLNGGPPLARSSGPCVKNGVQDRWLVPEVRSLESEDVNVVFSDGTSVVRAVIPGALQAPAPTLTELVFMGDQQVFVNLGFASAALQVQYAGTDGLTWTVETSGSMLSPPPGSGAGTATITGRALLEGSSCRGLAGCRAEVPFTLTVPARY